MAYETGDFEKLVRRIADEHPAANTAEIARLVIKETPPDEIGDYLEEALLPLVDEVLTEGGR